jgi:predicted RNA-binding Zn ribbon-like protein
MDAVSLDFLNSDWSDYRGSGRKEDRLTQTGWIEQFLARWNMQVALPPDEGSLRELGALRALLRRIVVTISSGEQPGAEDIADLNIYLKDAPLYRRLEPGGEGYQMQQEPLSRDWHWVQGEIAASFAELLTLDDPSRIKKCENGDCNWIYYDESRNHSRRWCDEGCASLIKVRRFRQRHHQHAV